jgi:hypothetical protein
MKLFRLKDGNYTNQRFNGSPLLLVALVLGWFALSPMTRAELPTPLPDGGYPGHNTAEGFGALNRNTTGESNTAIGYEALTFNTTGHHNAALGEYATVTFRL